MTRRPWLGVVADDFTGATDVSGTLAERGLATVQTFDVPAETVADCDAVVVALKTRNLSPAAAVAASIQATRKLRELGVEQIYLKYCSTFDSTDEGNIGPVADALQTELGASISLVCPATPAIGRTIYRGHLFVGDRLLSESSLRHHPLTPMTDPDLVRVLSRQTPSAVESLGYDIVESGADAIGAALAALAARGVRYVVADALTDRHLTELGRAAREHRLVTGAAGLAAGLAAARDANTSIAPVVAVPDGPAAVIAGSCSEATRGQIAAAPWPAFPVDPLEIAAGRDVVGAALRFATAGLGGGPSLIHSTAEPTVVAEAQRQLGAAHAAALVEETLARIGRGLVDLGVRRLIVAGGETSGAVVRALGITSVHIGRQVDPGVPWTFTRDSPALALLLKSGNLGGPMLFQRAFDILTDMAGAA